ncbi:hypothetical protein HQ560_05510 [bacterium]|nr:hypothetical protein [bacterium]
MASGVGRRVSPRVAGPVIVVALVVAGLTQAGCSAAREAATLPAPVVVTATDVPSTPQPEPSVDDWYITVSKEAEAEMRERCKRTTIRWLVVYNGTCSDAPALGLYARDQDVPHDAIAGRAKGFDFALTRKVADLLDEWGSVIIECHASYNSNWLSARFADKARVE